MIRTPGLQLSTMLKIVLDAHDTDTNTILSREHMLHPLRTMTSMKTNDEELNCIAAGHDLLNVTDVTLNDLVIAGFTDRILKGIILLKETDTIEQSLDNICQSEDTMKVAMACLLDRGALRNIPTCKSKKVSDYYTSYIRINNYLKDVETCALLGLKRPVFE